jgi:hypothetical protein
LAAVLEVACSASKAVTGSTDETAVNITLLIPCPVGNYEVPVSVPLSVMLAAKSTDSTSCAITEAAQAKHVQPQPPPGSLHLFTGTLAHELSDH